MENPRRLVLCLDGTWQNPYQSKKRDDGSKVLKPSNVLKIARAVTTRAPDGRDQVVFYDSGVGATVLYPGLANRVHKFFDSKLGGAWGAGFETNVEEAFRFLLQNYREGDEVFLFGFSRGAAQARALTRFLDWLGGIPTKRDAYFGPLYFLHYIVTRGTGNPGEVKTSNGEGPSEPLRPIRIEMLGVWDTVLSLGSRFEAREGTTGAKQSFHVGKVPARCVANARQALAVDEMRWDFQPEVWREHHPGQTLEQRWFAGAHANVGGGYVRDGLANVPLRWFLREAETLGLALDHEYTKHFRPYPQAERNDSRSLMYKVLEAIRFRSRKGRRKLVGYPASANLSLDPSVIHRLRADPAEHEQMTKDYRPRAVIEYLAQQGDLSAYLAGLGLDPSEPPFPADVMKALGG